MAPDACNLPPFPAKKIEHHHGKWPKKRRCEPCRWHNATGAHWWHRVHRWHKQIEHHHGKWPKNTDTSPVDGATPLAYIDGTMPIQTQLLGVPNFVIDGARPRHTSIRQNAYFSLSLACTYHKIRCRPKCTDHGKPPFSGTTARLSPCAIYSAVSLSILFSKRNTEHSAHLNYFCINCVLYSDIACIKMHNIPCRSWTQIERTRNGTQCGVAPSIQRFCLIWPVFFFARSDLPWCLPKKKWKVMKSPITVQKSRVLYQQMAQAH